MDLLIPDTQTCANTTPGDPVSRRRLLRAGAGLLLLPMAGGMAEAAEAASRMNGRALQRFVTHPLQPFPIFKW